MSLKRIERLGTVQISGEHCEIFLAGKVWKIKDLSRNGTGVDSERIQKGEIRDLTEGTLITVSYPHNGNQEALIQ